MTVDDELHELRDGGVRRFWWRNGAIGDWYRWGSAEPNQVYECIRESKMTGYSRKEVRLGVSLVDWLSACTRGFCIRACHSVTERVVWVEGTSRSSR